MSRILIIEIIGNHVTHQFHVMVELFYHQQAILQLIYIQSGPWHILVYLYLYLYRET